MNNTVEDFYFVYVITGRNYLRPIIKNITYLPKEANVVIITNTPQLLSSIKCNINLTVVDLESLRSDWSRENEFVLDIEDETEYMTKLKDLYRQGYKYPMGIMRYGIKWAVQNNISNFVLTDVGSRINTKKNYKEAFNELKDIASDRNVLFGNLYPAQNNNKGKGMIFKTYREVVNKYFPFISEDNYSEFIDGSVESIQTQISFVGLEGHTYGFMFKDLDLIEKFFNFWEDITIYQYENFNPDLGNASPWVRDFEFVSIIICSLFCRYHNIFLSGHKDIIQHLYMPENDFFAVTQKFPTSIIKWIPTETREEFLRVNKDNLCKHYGKEASIKLIDGFKEILDKND